MSENENKNKGGRPPLLVPDDKTLAKIEMCSTYQSSIEEIASKLNVSGDTVTRFLKQWPEAQEARDRGLASGKLALRAKQWKSAEKGNAAMLIWLGKQWLGQSDKIEQRTGEIAIHIDAEDAAV